jgi:hypothetical protein
MAVEADFLVVEADPGSCLKKKKAKQHNCGVIYRHLGRIKTNG